jgi:uncharacterized protein YkwD
MLPTLRHSLVLFALCFACLPGLRAADQKDEPKLGKEEQAVLDMTNQAREKEKLPPLKLNATLTEVARAHSQNMAKKGEMSHVLDGKKPNERVKAAGYDYAWVGENIAMTDGDTPEVIFKDWMDSPIHRENILKKEYEEIGVGVARNDKGEIYYTQVFGTPKKKR